MKGHKFSIDLSCNYPQWWRYNVYISIVCYDQKSQIIDYRNTIDRVYDIVNGEAPRVQPDDYPVARVISAHSAPCDHISLYLYVIANTFPQSLMVRESPPFAAQLTICYDDKPIQIRECEVNQLGGFTISGEMIYSQKQ